MSRIRILISIILVVIILFNLVGCSLDDLLSSNSPNSTFDPTKQEGTLYSLTLNLTSDSNALFSKYDLDIYVDNEKLTTIMNGETYSNTIKLSEGQHIIKAKNADNGSYYDTKTININCDTEFTASIAHESTKVYFHNDRIEYKRSEDTNTNMLNPYVLKLKLHSDVNLLFSTYGIEVVFDGEKITTIKNGEDYLNSIQVSEGKHELVVRSAENHSLKDKKIFDITENISYSADIAHDSSRVYYHNEKITGAFETSSSETTISTETKRLPTEPEVPMPVMVGTSLDTVLAKAKTYGLTRLDSDEDWGYGQKMCSLWTSQTGLSLDVVYSVKTHEILCSTFVAFNTVSIKEQKEFLFFIVQFLCPSSDVTEVTNWVKANAGKERKTTINGIQYELSVNDITGSLRFDAGESNWEDWMYAIGDWN